jgi:hypothetical protein
MATPLNASCHTNWLEGSETYHINCLLGDDGLHWHFSRLLANEEPVSDAGMLADPLAYASRLGNTNRGGVDEFVGGR